MAELLESQLLVIGTGRNSFRVAEGKFLEIENNGRGTI